MKERKGGCGAIQPQDQREQNGYTIGHRPEDSSAEDRIVGVRQVYLDKNVALGSACNRRPDEVAGAFHGKR